LIRGIEVIETINLSTSTSVTSFSRFAHFSNTSFRAGAGTIKIFHTVAASVSLVDANMVNARAVDERIIIRDFVRYTAENRDNIDSFRDRRVVGGNCAYS
jgi:hypothetical protein